jgi:hypothetical protein
MDNVVTQRVMNEGIRVGKQKKHRGAGVARGGRGCLRFGRCFASPLGLTLLGGRRNQHVGQEFSAAYANLADKSCAFAKCEVLLPSVWLPSSFALRKSARKSGDIWGADHSDQLDSLACQSSTRPAVRLMRAHLKNAPRDRIGKFPMSEFHFGRSIPSRSYASRLHGPPPALENPGIFLAPKVISDSLLTWTGPT